MKRIDAVCQELERLTRQSGAPQATAQKIGLNLGLARNSVSKELNQLWCDGRAIKIKSRPVYFLHRAVLESAAGQTLPAEISDLDTLHQLLTPRTPDVSDPFQAMIGYRRSLHSAIEKGKAAVLYPAGLHVLLTGPSGVGKTWFAELMHQFARQQQPDISLPFIYFNCAEYAHNPELLSSHLFGHRQGAFTGAAKDKTGLVAQADGGYLLLDEIHRLPYEGQEKLFSLLDRCEYRALGSSGEAQRVNIRLICTTTETVDSALLRTFLRRIQVRIALPALRERTLEEQIELSRFFLQRESAKTARPLRVDKALMLWLLAKPLPGNVGQLKSDIQFICAQAWAADMSRPEGALMLDKRFAVPPVSPSSALHQRIATLFADRTWLEISDRVMLPAATALSDLAGQEESDPFYHFLTREYVSLRNSNVPAPETLAILKNKLRSIFKYGLYSRDSATITVNGQMAQRLCGLIQRIEQVTGFSLPENRVNHLRRHILVLLDYVQRGVIPQIYSSSLILDHCQDEYQHAVELVRFIDDAFAIQCPPTEIVYLCLFLKACRQHRQQVEASPDLGVILIAHGSTTATSMAQYANQVLEQELFSAIDMPFEQSVHDTLDQLTQQIRRRGYDRLILMVDMGSLVHFASTVSQLFTLDVLLLPCINLSSLLEVGLDLTCDTRDLTQLYRRMMDKGIECQLCTPEQASGARVLVVSCITGMGTAEKIRKVLQESFGELMGQDSRLLMLDYADVRSPERLRQSLQPGERLVGIVGTFQPGLPDIPFISLEELFSEQGPELILGLFDPDLHRAERRQEVERCALRFVSALTLESIIDQISVLNPRRILQEMELILQQLCQQLDISPGRQVTLRFLIHCCCMVERIVISRKPLQMVLENGSDRDAVALSVIKTQFSAIEAAYAIQLSDAEYHYIYQLLFS
jgi:sigma-54 dependent dga operon transcriptional activator